MFGLFFVKILLESCFAICFQKIFNKEKHLKHIKPGVLTLSKNFRTKFKKALKCNEQMEKFYFLEDRLFFNRIASTG